MNNTKIKIAVAAAFVAMVAVYPALSKNATLTMLFERYPTINPTVAKKAYKNIMSQALRGKLDCSNWSEEQFNTAFLQEVARLNAAK